MAKVTGAYTSLMRGVSQQPPEQRLDGQHHAQTNMWSDPVIGLTRRRGSVAVVEQLVASSFPVPTRTDLQGFFERSFKLGGRDYSILFRKQPRPAGSVATGVYMYDKDSEVFVPVVTDASAEVATMLAAGVSAYTQVGRYAVIAGNNLKGVATSVPLWESAGNSQQGAVWIRGGAYSRTYKITVRVAGTTHVFTHTTPSSAYPGALDTSDIPIGAADYQKQVNDRVNAYNSAVTAWVGTASAAIQPAAIAAALAALLVGAGAGVVLTNSTIGIVNAGLEGIDVDDGGDGTLARSVYQVIPQASDASTTHFVGKVIKVQAKDTAPAYYIKAVPRTPGTSGLTQVTWEEAAGELVDVGAFLSFGTLEGGTFYVARSIGDLATLVPSVDVPPFANRTTGDRVSNKAPYFLDHPVTYLGVFQDRLVVGAGGVLTLSEVGNYFNFFRTSVLTVIDSDPVEVYALGSENDTIRHSVMFDKSLLLFGDEQQYVINGRVPLTPATSVVVQSSAYEGTTDAAPVASGDYVFYFKKREEVLQAYQIALGQVVEDTSNAVEITQQISGYIQGTPVEAIAFTSPDVLLVRSNSNSSEVYAYRYLDVAAGKRVVDSWSKWEFPTELGNLISLSAHNGELLLFWSRQGPDAGGSMRTWVAVDRLSLIPSVSPLPYLDSMRRYSGVVAGASTRAWHTQPYLSAAWDNTQPGRLHGADTLTDVPALIAEVPGGSTAGLWVGVKYSSSVTLTNPYKRDREGTAKLGGRLTITKFVIGYTDTAAIKGYVATGYAQGGYTTTTALDFNARFVGTAVVGEARPITSGFVPMMVGRENREFLATLESVSWLPMGFTSIQWVGQHFLHST